MLREPWPQAAHGSDLQRALNLYGGNAAEWLDLSSAVSPFSWATETDAQMSVRALHHLPEPQQTWQAVVQDYYGEPGLMIAGSQQAIRHLPQCFESARIWVLKGSYGEHLSCWSLYGHRLTEKSAADLRAAFNGCEESLPDLLIVVNPGNPGGEFFNPAELRQWAALLAEKQGWLICDEAFIDTIANGSLLQAGRPDNAIVLRSVGKFFGLAGLRSGFVFAHENVLATLASRIGPWTVTGIAQPLLSAALQDRQWQQLQGERLQLLRARMLALCAHLPVVGDTALFVTLHSPRVDVWHQRLAQEKIWTRLFVQQQRLRLGWPASEEGWQRLAHTLKTLSSE